MVGYAELYHLMVDAAENAISAIKAQNYGMAKNILIHAEREAEERYIETAEDGEPPIPTVRHPPTWAHNQNAAKRCASAHGAQAGNERRAIRWRAPETDKNAASKRQRFFSLAV